MPAALERTALSVLAGFVGKAVLIMVLIALAAVATPYAARFVDSRRKPHRQEHEESSEHQEHQDNQEHQEQTAEVKSIFGADSDEDFDPNYKIYNTDIYGVEKKHGKKQ